MDLQIKGQLALVTGSTSGHGKEVAKILLREGARVVINSFSEEEINKVKDEMSALGDAYFIVGDQMCIRDRRLSGPVCLQV